MVDSLETLAEQVAKDYIWLASSAYAGRPDVASKVRGQLRRAAEMTDDAYASLVAVSGSLGALVTFLDKFAAAEEANPDHPANSGDIRRAHEAKARRQERAERSRRNGDPFPYSEITG